MTEIPIRYLTVDELVYINEHLPNIKHTHLELYGKRRVRDMDLLEAAVGRPQQSVFGEDAYLAIHEKMAALLHSIVRNHPFSDGNKRTGTVAILFMAVVNGCDVKWQAEIALEQIVGVAEGEIELQDFATWLPLTVTNVYHPEEDEDVDIPLMNQLMEKHRWLLDALAER